MKTIIGILLVGLLGFLGCSDSDDGTSAVIGEATPVAPFGIIETPKPTYEWTPVRWATEYLLLVEDADETVVIEQRYTPEESGCSTEDGLCAVTPDTEVIGENAWKVQAWANNQYGVWSEPLNFDFTAMNDPRFTDNGDGTVTDNKTKLMWSKNANLFESQEWEQAKSSCDGLTLAGHSDWSLPSISELWSLVDISQFNPALPAGHPFTIVPWNSYSWSSTTVHGGVPPPCAWNVSFITGSVFSDEETSEKNVWCVRGGH